MNTGDQMKQFLYLFPLLFAILWGCQASEKNTTVGEYSFANEKHFRNIKMLTTEGENAEAYFSFDQEKLIFQSRYGKYLCDQIFLLVCRNRCNIIIISLR